MVNTRDYRVLANNDEVFLLIFLKQFELRTQIAFKCLFWVSMKPDWDTERQIEEQWIWPSAYKISNIKDGITVMFAKLNRIAI